MVQAQMVGGGPGQRALVKEGHAGVSGQCSDSWGPPYFPGGLPSLLQKGPS